MQSGQSPRDASWFAKRMPSEDVVSDVLQGDPVARLLGIARDRAIANVGLDIAPRTGVDDAKIVAMLKLATATAKRLSEQGERIQLSADEEAALDLFILLVARPAIFVQNGRITERPENWPEIGRDQELFPRTTACVGRIETALHVKIGTGFVVGKQRILTNNHVLCALFGVNLQHWQRDPSDFAKRCDEHSKLWTDNHEGAPVFELRGEFGSNSSSRARLKRVLGHHHGVDMAVVELDSIPPDSRVLSLMADEPDAFAGRRIYAVGYPVDDVRNVLGDRVTPASVFSRVFGADHESLGTKRFSPGIVLGWLNSNIFTHDASTLPGSSGSCIVDFEDRRVVGLHFGGSYRAQNYAVSVWKFRDDPVLKENGVLFT